MYLCGSFNIARDDVKAVELRKHAPNLLTIVVQPARIVGLFECLVWLASSHIP